MMMFVNCSMVRHMMRHMTQKRSVIHFSDEELKVLKAKAQQEAGTWISTNEALIAHLHPLLLDAFNISDRSKIGALLPVNWRGKISGVTERWVGNNVSVIPLVYDLDQDGKTAAKGIHEVMRAGLSEQQLVSDIKFTSASFDAGAFYEHKDLGRTKAGVIQQWNYQATNPYFEVDFGVGKPNRSQP